MKQPGPNEPNVRFSEVYANINTLLVQSHAIGAFWDIRAETTPYRDVNERVYYGYEDKNGYLCFDKRSGLIIRHYKSFGTKDKSVSREVEFFAGPNSVSETPSASLGRFYDPIVSDILGWASSRIALYDKEIRRFYVIDFAGGNVSEGLQLAEGDSREPIPISMIEIEGGGIANTIWSPPMIWNDAESVWKQQRVILPDGSQSSKGYGFTMWDYTFIPVLDKTGRIHIYNTKEQTLTNAGYLPTPQSLFGTERLNEVANPRDVLAYYFCPVYAVLGFPKEPNVPRRILDTKYLGMNVTCVSREGMEMAMAVFDPNGRMICRGDTDTMTSSEPGTPLAATVLLLLENLQPPVFEVASYLCGNCIEASAGHRALFILPNSFLGMLGRYQGVHFDREVFLPLLMGPSLILSVWLGLKVWKNATIIGYSGKARMWWMVGTFAFGLPAYITYRLTRHKEVLVTCQNCGKLRRPDMEMCHHCGSKWEVPELMPPNWRICD
jgi:hypothetical protein